MHKIFSITLVIGIFLMGSCGLFENIDEQPMFIKLENPSLVVQTNEGSTAHGILDVWPSADGQSLGVFEMPVTIPVLDENETTSMIYFAGVRKNGALNEHVIYPFYKQINVDLSFAENTTIDQELEFTYRDDVVFEFIEDFEGVHNVDHEVDGNLETMVELTNEGCAEGFCGLIKLTPENNAIEVSSGSQLNELPTNGSPIYLEMNFKNDINLQVGLQAEFANMEVEQYLLVLVPTDEWKKVYVDFSSFVQESQLTGYRVLFGAQYNGEEEAEIRIDNLKLLHF